LFTQNFSNPPVKTCTVAAIKGVQTREGLLSLAREPRVLPCYRGYALGL
jgi:hypothetical protein